MNPLPINPAIVAAALNQWSLIGNMQGGGGGGDQVGSFALYASERIAATPMPSEMRTFGFDVPFNLC